MLLERPGEIATREELQKKLWPGDTFVEYEPGLNNAMKRLRAALDDDPDTPHFIETLPRRGYRFIGTLNGVPQGISTTETQLALQAQLGNRKLRRLTGVGTLVLLALAALLVGLDVGGLRDRILARNPKPKIQAIAVLPLTNLSGDPSQEYFSDGMTEELIVLTARR
jgi:DNA-binding winged helix-turn-helix (wHTH) protein